MSSVHNKLEALAQAAGKESGGGADGDALIGRVRRARATFRVGSAGIVGIAGLGVLFGGVSLASAATQGLANTVTPGASISPSASPSVTASPAPSVTPVVLPSPEPSVGHDVGDDHGDDGVEHADDDDDHGDDAGSHDGVEHADDDDDGTRDAPHSDASRGDEPSHFDSSDDRR